MEPLPPPSPDVVEGEDVNKVHKKDTKNDMNASQGTLLTVSSGGSPHRSRTRRMIHGFVVRFRRRRRKKSSTGSGSKSPANRSLSLSGINFAFHRTNSNNLTCQHYVHEACLILIIQLSNVM